MRRLIAVVLVVVASAALAVLRPWSDGSEATAKRDPCRAHIDRVDLGDSFEGLRVKRMRLCEPPERWLVPGPDPPSEGVNALTAAYGTCHAGDDQGCSPPVEVQVWRACEHYRAQYTAKMPRRRRATLRGVPALIINGGTQIELYTGSVTVVVFTGTRRARHAVTALRGTVSGRRIEPGEPFPPPVPGALDGALAC